MLRKGLSNAVRVPWLRIIQENTSFLLELRILSLEIKTGVRRENKGK